MSKYFFFLALICSQQFVAQEIFVGRVLDESTQEPLPFVNIGIVGENIGTVSDFSGNFELEVNTPLSNSEPVRFSMIGYAPKDVTLQELRENPQPAYNIVLAEKATALEEVVVTGEVKNNYKTKILGNKTTSKMIYGTFTTNRLGNEVGLIIRGRKSKMFLDEFNVSIVQNTYGTVRFRLNFYSVENGLPNENILKENIIIETNITTGILTVDLTPYNIVMDGDFFVAMEWIEDLGEGNLFFSAGFFGAPLIAREVSQGHWAKSAAASLGMNVTVRY